jgi:CHAT domain-containing protein
MLDQFQQALTIARELGDRLGEGYDLDDIGSAYALLGNHAQAVEYFKKALALADEVAGLDLQWKVRSDFRDTLASLHHSEEAIFWGKQAVNFIQTMRQSAASLPQSLQRSFLHSKTGAYQGLADLLIDQGRLPEAEQVLAMLKEDEYFDFIRRDAARDSRRTLSACNTVEIPWCDRYSQIGDHVAALGKEYGELSQIRPEARTAEQQARYSALQKDLIVARQEYADFFKQLETDLRKVNASASITESAVDVLKSLRAEQGDLKSMGHGAVIVHYLVTPERLRILLTTADIQLHRDADISALELNRRIEEFRQALQTGTSDPRPTSEALYDVLIHPIEHDLMQSGAETVMVSLSGSLRYIPFSALYDPEQKQYFVEKYAVVLYSEAAKSHLADPRRPHWNVAALGMSEAAPPFPALSSVPAELDGIVRDMQHHTHGVLPGVERLNASFTAAELTRLLEQNGTGGASQFSVLHIASHFAFSPGVDTDSFLLLGDKSQLTLADFANGAYPLNGVDLLTLSACDTAVGNSSALGGAEVDGLAAVAQNDGARSVMASLWEVVDATTGVFMQRFYQLREQQHLTKAEALRQVQLGFIRGEVNSVSLRKIARGLTRVDKSGLVARRRPESTTTFSHPYFWAPFILMGNWL